MSFSRGFDDAGKSATEALTIIVLVIGILFVGMIFSLVYTTISSTKTSIGDSLLQVFQETFNMVDTFLNLLIFAFSLTGTLGIIETFSKAIDDPEWGIGYAAGLAIISPLAILVVAVLLSAPHVPQLKGLLGFVDPSDEIIAATTGAILGLIIYFIKKLVQSELEDSYYWL